MGKMADRLRKKRKKTEKVSSSRLSTQEVGLLKTAILAQEQGDSLGALASYERFYAINSQNFDVLHNMSVILYNQKNYDAALHYLNQAHVLCPKELKLYKIIGLCHLHLYRYTGAEKYFSQYCEHYPNDLDGLYAYIEVLQNQNKLTEALKTLKTIPDDKISYRFLVQEIELLCALKQPEAAVVRAEEEMSKHNSADRMTYLPALALAYKNVHRYDDELAIHQEYVDINPDMPEALSNLGQALAGQGLHEEALHRYDQALAINKNLGEVYVNKVNSLRRLGRFDEAIENGYEALKISPVNARAHYALGVAMVQGERYEGGWSHVEWNWHTNDLENFRPTSALPIWLGEDLLNKHLVLFVDQGIGDTILCLRYIPLIQKNHPKAKITLICEKKLEELLRNALDDDIAFLAKESLKRGSKLQGDAMAALCSLPMLFDTAIHDIPADVPYIKSSRALGYKQTPDDIVIGITWNTISLDAGHKRNVSLLDFKKLADLPGVKLLNLQYGDTTDDRAACGFDVIHDPDIDAWSDLQGHVDQIEACDLVISIDNTTVHAAGAMGKPVWTMLPHDAYWRWHGNKHNSTPWYPSMRLFRQGKDADYEPVLTCIKAELEKYIEGDRSVLLPEIFVPTVENKKAKATAVFMNDTYTWYHWGCTATSGAIINQLESKGYDVVSVPHLEISKTPMPVPNLSQFDDPKYIADYAYQNPSLFYSLKKAGIVVVNGEGTIHGMAMNGIRLLFFCYILSTVYKKKVYLINHACFPEDGLNLTDPEIIAFYLKAYRAVEYVSVRDPYSHDLLKQLGVESVLAFDSLPLTARTWIQNNPKQGERNKKIVLAGSSKFNMDQADAFKKTLDGLLDDGYELSILLGAAIHKAGDDAAFCAFVKDLVGKEKVTVNVVESLDEWFSELQRAALLISGRFHYTIAAACFGTPFVAFEGNTPKLHALSEFLNEEKPLSYSSSNLTMELQIRTVKALRNGAVNERDRQKRIDKMCELALKNYQTIPRIG